MAEVQAYSEIQRVREALRDSPKSSDSKPAMNKSSENPFFQHAGIHLIIFWLPLFLSIGTCTCTCSATVIVFVLLHI